jgi:predicted Zn-dependent protease/predicted negative regulator of RcsB-dependent stress response
VTQFSQEVRVSNAPSDTEIGIFIMDQPRLIRRLVSISVTALFVLLLAVAAGAWFMSRQDAFEEIARAYYAGEHELVIEAVDRLLEKQTISDENASVLLWKAESQYRLGQRDAALSTYRQALTHLERLTNNVALREYAESYLRFAEMLGEARQFDRAFAAVDDSLRLAPQNVAAQILIGQLLTDSGQNGRALAHYQKQLASRLPVAEEQAVLMMKIARLSPGGSPTIDPALESLPLYTGLSIGLVPMYRSPEGVVLEDVCVILEASWRVRCNVLPSLDINSEGLWVAERSQFDADALLDEVTRRLPWPERRHSHVVALTEYDIFGPQTNYVFSWQRINDEHGEAVLSTYRLASEIPSYYEPAIIGTRRVAIQTLSTTGRMFRFERPTDPECPGAYPQDLREFQMKRLRLCPSEEAQRDALLRRRGGDSGPMGKTKAQAIARVMERYFVE